MEQLKRFRVPVFIGAGSLGGRAHHLRGVYLLREGAT